VPRRWTKESRLSECLGDLSAKSVARRLPAIRDRERIHAKCLQKCSLGVSVATIFVSNHFNRQSTQRESVVGESVNTDSKPKPEDEKAVPDLSNLYARRESLLTDRYWTRDSPRNAWFASAFCAIAFFMLLIFGAKFPEHPQAVLVIEAFFALIFIGFGVLGALEFSKLRQIDKEFAAVESAIDLSTYGLKDKEVKAEQMLRTNDLQLRQYYELNLNQNRWVFLLGVGCIGTGVLIIAATMYTLLQLKGLENKTPQIVIASLGAVGSILTNFVAVIYLKMNAGTSENLASFHSRLVETHQLMLGSLLTSRIDDDTKRWDTLAALALKMAPAKDQTK
jgi:hypothetical protein